MPKKNALKKVLGNQKGVTLLMVLFALVFLSILTVAMLGISSNNLVQSEGERRTESAYYVAEGGVTKVMSEVESLAVSLFRSDVNKSTFYDRFHNALPGIETEIDSFGSNRGEQQKANVVIKKLTAGNEGEYRFESTGLVGNRERTVFADFKGKLVNKFIWPVDLALHTQSTVYMQGQAKIAGNIGTISTQPNSIEIVGADALITGNIYVPAGEEAEALKIQHNKAAYQERVKVLPDITAYELPVFPAFPVLPAFGDLSVSRSTTVAIGSDRSFGKISVSGDTTVLTFDLNNQDRQIVVDEFAFTSGSKIKISGTGRLTVYIKNIMNFNNGYFNTDSTTDRLSVFYAGTAGELIKGNAQTVINGSLYAKQANLLLEGGGGFLGHVITGGTSVEIKGGHRVGVSLIYAPLANVKLTGGGQVEGTIVSKTYFSDGTSTLTQKPIEVNALLLLDKLDGRNYILKMTKSPLREK